MKRSLLFLISFLIYIQLLQAQRPSWAVNESVFQQSATIICSANVNGVFLSAPNDIVAAFVGNECRGVAKPLFIQGSNRYLFFLVIFSNSQGETIRFKIYNSSTDKVIDVDAKINFQINQQIGTLFQPFSLAFPKLRTEANLFDFDLANIRYDSVINVIDPISKLSTYNFYLRFGLKKDSAIFSYKLSQGAKLFLNQVEVISGLSIVDVNIPRQFQVKSEDESFLTTFNVYLINAASLPPCWDTLKNNPIPLITVTKKEFCIGDSATLTASNALRYQWSTGDTSASIKVKNSGSYNVMVTYANGCRITSPTQTIVVNPKPTALPIVSVSVCAGTLVKPLSVDPNAGNSILWYGTNSVGGAASTSAPAPSTTNPGIIVYYLSQVSQKGCESDRSAFIHIVHALPIKPLLNWDGNAIFTNASYANYQWLLNDVPITGATDSKHKPLSAGSYKLIVGNKENCSDTSVAFSLVVTTLAPPISIKERVNIFPNPVQDFTFLDLGSIPYQHVEVQLIDMQGRLIDQWRELKQQINRLDLKEKQQGTYTLRIKNGKLIKTIILQKR